MQHRLALALCAPLLLAACVVPAPDPGASGDACGASAHQDLLGRPGRLLDGMRFARDVRVIRPGTAVTMDFSADRLNFRLDDRGVIVQVVCG